MMPYQLNLAITPANLQTLIDNNQKIILAKGDVENEEIGNMLEGMFNVLELLYEDCQKQMHEETIDTNIRPEEVYLIANLEKQQWDILTPKQMSEKYKN